MVGDSAASAAERDIQLNSDNAWVTPIEATEDELYIVGRVIRVGRRVSAHGPLPMIRQVPGHRSSYIMAETLNACPRCSQQLEASAYMCPSCQLPLGAWRGPADGSNENRRMIFISVGLLFAAVASILFAA
jgi:hypothetical protein